MTLAGFARRRRANVYTGSGRVSGAPIAQRPPAGARHAARGPGRALYP